MRVGIAKQEWREDLADAIRERTRELHTRAERSGIIRELVRGSGTRQSYALYLRNLLPAYEAMERGLRQPWLADGVTDLARSEVYRAETLDGDLRHLCGPDWSRSLELLPAAERYARAVAAAAAGDGSRLIAHAYVRYLGDMSGGQILKRILAKSLGLGPDALSFYDFPAIDDIEAFKTEYREAVDRAGRQVRDRALVIEEAAAAFEHNILVSLAVEAHVALPS